MVLTNKRQQSTAPITRSLVLQNVLEADSDYDGGLFCSSDSLTNSWHSYAAIENDEHVEINGSLPPGASFEDIFTWLDVQCETEQARLDCVPEEECQSGYHPQKHNQLIQGPETAVLDRIRRGYGPRTSKFEDLLCKLRINTSGDSPGFSKRPRKESYEEMKHVLLYWNNHVASAYDDPEARIALVHAMYARVSFLHRILSHRRSADAHDDTSRKLLHAIHAYRPETADFETQDTCNLLTIILAHIGFAIPDIDQELKYLIFYTLVTKRGYMAHTANADTRHKLEEKIANAIRRRDSESATKYERKMSDWTRGVFEKNCDIIASRVQTARRNVELKTLDELQTLTILQTAQKIVLDERLSKRKPPSQLLIPRSTWLPIHSHACVAADAGLEDVVETHITDLLASVKVVAQNTADMEYVARARILTRALKFAGLDLKNVSEAERRRVVQERMANLGTVSMMGNAVEGITETKDKAREMVEAMGKMEVKLEEMLKSAEGVGAEYGELAKLVDSDLRVSSGDEVHDGGGLE
jgi:hypothetical protein